jgi:hypothetical protein
VHGVGCDMIDFIQTNRSYPRTGSGLMSGCDFLMCLIILSFLVHPRPCDIECLQGSCGQKNSRRGSVPACIASRCRLRSLDNPKAFSQPDTVHLNARICFDLS